MTGAVRDDGLAARPRGPLAEVMGVLMARHNAGMSRSAVERLAPEADDRVLDIGFGPGHTTELLARRVDRGFVAGVDLSPQMAQIARRRIQVALPESRVELCAGSVSALPFATGSFTKIVASNTVQFWPDLPHDLREVRRVLRPGGTLVLCVRLPRRGMGVGFGPEQLEDLAAAVRAADFGEPDVATIGRAATLRAVRPNS